MSGGAHAERSAHERARRLEYTSSTRDPPYATSSSRRSPGVRSHRPVCLASKLRSARGAKFPRTRRRLLCPGRNQPQPPRVLMNYRSLEGDNGAQRRTAWIHREPDPRKSPRGSTAFKSGHQSPPTAGTSVHVQRVCVFHWQL